MSSTPRCDPKFPTERCLVDASALVRFFKCGAIDLLARTSRVVIAGQVAREFKRRPGQRTALAVLGVEVRSVKLGSGAYEQFCRLRGATATTRDLGEDETIALALDARARGEALPVVIFDDRAGRDAVAEGLTVLDFLDTVSWLVGCGLIAPGDADALVQRAGPLDGFRPPPGYGGSIESVRAARQTGFMNRFASTL
jgi:predicted nucleic acid-binding protein